MSSDFFDLEVDEQITSLTQVAHELLVQYSLSSCVIKSINFEFNATFSVVSES